MTATVARPDVVDVLKRADGQYAKRAGDDPAIPEYLTAVRPLLGQPTAGPVDDVQMKQLLADKQRLGDLAGELRKQADSRAKVIDGQTRQIAELKQQLDAADEDARRRIDAAVGAIQARPCKCEKPYPRSYADAEFEEVVPDVEPWGDLFGRIRDQVAEAGWTA